MTGDQTAPQTLTTAVDPEELAQKIPQLAERQIVQGTVVRVDNEGVLVDVGAKSEGLIPPAELSREASAPDVRGGDRIDVMVVQVKGELLATMQGGMVAEGPVKRLTDFGAFVDLGGTDGLLPISEMSWTYIKHPSEVIRRNQRLKLTVLRVDREAGRISLGLKQILEDPWQKVGGHVRVGDIVKGKVVRLVSAGAFVRLGDLDAFLPIAEAAEKRVNKIEDVLRVGDAIEAMVAEIRADERRMQLSVRKMERERERTRVKEVLRQQEEESRITIGDIAGALLQQAVASATVTPAATDTADRNGEEEVPSGS